MKSIAHPNGSKAEAYFEGPSITIDAYNEDGSYMAHYHKRPPQRFVRRLVLIEEERRENI